MKWHNRHGRILSRWAGVLLLLFGLASGYWWFYKLGPVRHTLDPVQFSLSNRAVSAHVERGLLEYAACQRRWPEAIGVGRLPFAQKDAGREDHSLPVFVLPVVQIAAYAITFAPAVLGAALLLLSFRKGKQRGES
jgi:hypothetical protein